MVFPCFVTVLARLSESSLLRLSTSVERLGAEDWRAISHYLLWVISKNLKGYQQAWSFSSSSKALHLRQGVWIWLSGQSRIGIRHLRGGDQYRTTIWFAVTLWPRVRGTWNRTRDRQFLATISDILYIYAFKPLALLKPVNVYHCLSF